MCGDFTGGLGLLGFFKIPRNNVLLSFFFLLPPRPDGECWDERLNCIIKPCVLVSVTIERAVC